MHRILTTLTAIIGPPIMRIICSSNRLSITTKPTIVDYVAAGGNILACWHSRLFYLAYYYTYRTKLPKVLVLLSRSRDGDYAYAITRALGHLAVRGSTRRGGTRAARTLLKGLADGYNVLITPDGPRGPAFKVHRGIIWLASTKGARLVPVSYDASSKWTFGSWDHFILPKPLARVHISVGEPILVPRDIDDKGIEDYRLRLQTELQGLDQACKQVVSDR